MIIAAKTSTACLHGKFPFKDEYFDLYVFRNNLQPHQPSLLVRNALLEAYMSSVEILKLDAI